MLGMLQAAALIAATLTTGLSAGLYYGFACAVMPGLARADDRTFVQAMRRVNTAILNGWFLLLFLGSLLLILAAGALHIDGSTPGVLPWIVAALVLYVAVLGVTMGFNVPLNNALDAGGLPDAREAAEMSDAPGTPDAPAGLRAEFETSWVRWNIVRTVLNTAAFACLTWALVRYGHAA
ncbi:anthrone oxygenase family protein [Streptomyces sp. NPDC054796]